MKNVWRGNLFVAMGALSGALAVTILGGCGGAEGLNTGASSPTTVIVKKEKADGAGAAEKAPAGNVAPAGAAPVAAGGFGTIKGKVVFKGDPPKLAPLFEKGAIMKEPICVKTDAIPNEKLVVGTGNGVANVFIFLPKAPAGVAVPPPPDTPVKFDQKDCRFVPHAVFLRSNQPLKILNSDVVSHNTHTYAQRSTANFNQLIAPGNTTGIDFKYDRGESKPCEVKCDIHPWMLAHHLPLDNPWGAISGPNGEFEIKDVPSGTHKFQVWHEAAAGGGYLERNLSITVKPGEVTTIEIPYESGKFEQ
jgi:hypothetical protein